MIEEINEFKDAVDLLSQLNSQYGLHDLWWRGQSDYNWQLVPGIFRDNHRNEYEANLIT